MMSIGNYDVDFKHSRGNCCRFPMFGRLPGIIGIALAGCLIVQMVGCGAGTDDPALISSLKDAGLLAMKNQQGQVYQVKLLMKPLTEDIANDIASLADVKNLAFDGSEITDELFAKAVGGLNPVSMVLSDTAISDTGIAAMAKHRRMEAIFLQNTPITDESLKTIGKLTALMELDLTNTKITSAGLAHLTKLGSLKRLILDKTAIDDAGLEHLKALTNLSVLEIRETAATADGISALQSAVEGLSVDR